MIPAQLRQWLDLVLDSSKRYQLDPAIVLGIMQVETGGRNIVGDFGHGRGLMQIDDRSHGAWLAAHNGGMDPASNIDYGCSILRANINAFDCELRPGIAAYNCGAGNAAAGLRDYGDPDRYTTGCNYSTRVLGNAALYRPELEEEFVLIPQEYIEKFNLADAHDIVGLIANYEGVVKTAFEQGCESVEIPQEYVDKFNLPDHHAVKELIDNFEGVVKTAYDNGYADGLHSREPLPA